MRYLVVFIGIALITTVSSLNIVSANVAILLAYILGLVIGTWR